MGETILGQGFALGPGGKGSNQAVAAARAGGRYHFISRLARERLGDLALRTWARAASPPPSAATRATRAAYIFSSPAPATTPSSCPASGGDISESRHRGRADLIRSRSVF
jgi:ribokinase